jgi:hypothetical protein
VAIFFLGIGFKDCLGGLTIAFGVARAGSPSPFRKSSSAWPGPQPRKLST